MIAASFAPHIPGDWMQPFTVVKVRPEIPLECDAFLRLWETRKASVWEWEGGRRGKAHILACHGLMLDFDQGKPSLDEMIAKLTEAGECALLLPSAHHRTEKHGDDAWDRFHVVLPFLRPVLPSIGLEAHHHALDSGEFPGADKAALDLARVFEPGPHPAIFLPGVRYRNPYKGLEMGNTYSIDTSIRLASGQEVRAEAITAGHHACHCPFHEDTTPSAFVKILEDGRQMLFCSTCSAEGKGPWWLETNGQAEIDNLMTRLFLVENELKEVMRPEFAEEDTPGPVARRRGFVAAFTPRGAFLDKKVVAAAKAELATKRKWSAAGFQQSTLKGGARRSDAWFSFTSSGICFIEPMAPPSTRDNPLVDAFLADRFGKHAPFIKRWLAVYAYQNFQHLPVLVLSGKRGGGKTTFANMVSSLYPGLSTTWDGKVTAFTEWAEKALVVVDDNANDKADLYAAIKTATGNESAHVNVKYGLSYHVPNNANFILTSNDILPLFVKWNEGADTEANNQWFFHELPPLGKAIAGDHNARLKAAFPYYARTVLFDEFEAWLDEGSGRDVRYGVPAPVTELQEEVFGSSVFLPDVEAARIVDFLKSADARDNFSGLVRPAYGMVFNETDILISQLSLREVMGSGLAGRFTSSPKSVLESLKKSGLVDREASKRTHGNIRWYKMRTGG